MSIMQLSEAINSTNDKNISFTDCLFNGNITLPENTNNQYASIKFLGAGNTTSSSVTVSNFKLPSTGAAPGMICQFMGRPVTGSNILSVYSGTAWQPIYTMS